tara:strand:- start:680 stop:1801 length:1122 start_codon:yes stop_codon:yes gene_type:complete
MDQDEITLELLVIEGNATAVDKYATTKGIDESKKEEKITEAGIYSVINFIRTSDCGVDSEPVCEFLNQEKFTDYFSTTTNTRLLVNMIDSIRAGTASGCEIYGDVSAIDVLTKPMSDAFTRNIESGQIKEKLTKLTDRAYSIIFDVNYVHEMGGVDALEKRFSILKEWKNLVDCDKIVESAIREMQDVCELFEDKAKTELAYAVFDKLTELSDKKTVSLLIHHYLPKEDYQKSVDDGKIEPFVPSKKQKSAIEKAIEVYESSFCSSNSDIRKLEKVVKDKDKKYIAEKMGEWYKEGKMRSLSQITKYPQTLYDEEIAKKVLGNAIAESCQKGELEKLQWALELPQQLIDTNNSAIQGFVEAYKLNQETKKEVE